MGSKQAQEVLFILSAHGMMNIAIHYVCVNLPRALPTAISNDRVIHRQAALQKKKKKLTCVIHPSSTRRGSTVLRVALYSFVCSKLNDYS